MQLSSSSFSSAWVRRWTRKLMSVWRRWALWALLLVLVLAMHYASDVYFETALLIATFSCVGTTAMAKFLLRGEVIE